MYLLSDLLVSLDWSGGPTYWQALPYIEHSHLHGQKKMFKWHYCDIGLFIPLLLILLCNLIDGFCSMGEMDNIQHQRHCRKILIWINSLLALLFSWNLLRFEKVLRIFSLKFDPLRRIDYPSPSFLSLSLYDIQMVVHFVDGWCYFFIFFYFLFFSIFTANLAGNQA